MSKGKIEKAYIIDFGNRAYAEVRKLVTFVKGVGILDHYGVSRHRPDIYSSVDDGRGHPRPSGQYASFDLLALAEYFAGLGFTVTEVTETGADKIRKDLAAGKIPPEKYLKEVIEPIPEPSPTGLPDNVIGGEDGEGNSEIDDGGKGGEGTPVDEDDLVVPDGSSDKEPVAEPTSKKADKSKGKGGK